MAKEIKVLQTDAFGQPFHLSFSAFDGGLKESNLPKILEWLAQAVINRPYHDLPDDFLDILGHRIYRPNHDVAHSMRQVMYLQVLRTWMMKYGKEPYKTAVKDLTTREWNLLSLAAFLFRSGRTNEQSSKSGLTQNKNSAEIFKAVALSLGFPDSEVEVLAWCLEHYAPLTSDAINSLPIDTPKTRLFNGFLLLAHNGDLPRCWDNENEIGLSTRDNFTALMDLTQTQINQLHQAYLGIARLLCNVTGTAYFWPSEFGSEKFKPHVVYKQLCISRFNDAWAQLEFYTGCVVKILQGPLGGELDEIKELMNKSQNMPFGGGRLAAVTTLQQAFFDRKARQRQERVLGSRFSTSHSMRRVIRDLSSTPFSEAEIGLIKRLETYPWVIKHAIPTTKGMDITAQIQEDMRLLSSDDLGRTIHTNILEGGTKFVFLSVGGPNTGVADFLKIDEPDTISIQLSDFIQEGKLTTPLSHMKLLAPQVSFTFEESFSRVFNGHSMQIRYLKDAANKPAQKIVKVVWPNGEIRERVLERMDEAVEGVHIIQWLSLNILVMIRMMSPECQARCLEDTSLLDQLIDLVCDFRNFEILIPRQLLLSDPRIHWHYHRESVAGMEETRKKIRKAYTQGAEALRFLFADPGLEPNFLMTETETLLHHFLCSTDYIPSIQSLTVTEKAALAKILIDRGAMLRSNSIPSLIATLISKRQKDLALAILKQCKYDLQNDTFATQSILGLGNDAILDEFEALGMRYHLVPLSFILALIADSPNPDADGVALINRLQRTHYPFTQSLGTERELLRENVALLEGLGYDNLINALTGVGVRFHDAKIDDKPLYCYVWHPKLGVLGVRYEQCRILTGFLLPQLGSQINITKERLRDSLFQMTGYRMQSFSYSTRILPSGAGLCQVTLTDSDPHCFPTDLCREVHFFSESDFGTIEKWSDRIELLTVYREAVSQGNVGQVKELLQYRPVDIFGEILYLALEQNPIHADLLDALLTAGIYDINQSIVIGKGEFILPLILAIYKKDLTLVNLLLQQGALPEVVDSQGFNPMMAAVIVNSLPLLSHLLQCGAKLSAANDQSLLAFACLNQCSDEVFRWVLERTEDVNKPYQRINPLSIAVRMQNANWAEALVLRGADVTTTDARTGQSMQSALYSLVPHLALTLNPNLLPVTEQLGVKGLLDIQGHGQDYNLNEALKSAYGLVSFDDLGPVSQAWLKQIRQDAKLPDSVDLCCCLFGKEAVVPCVGIDTPTLAFNLDYLSKYGNQTTYLALVFALRLQYELILTGKMQPFSRFYAEDFQTLDAKVVGEFSIPYSEVTALLQNEAAYAEGYKGAYFEWSTQYRSYPTRLKVVLYQMQSQHLDHVDFSEKANHKDLQGLVSEASTLIRSRFDEASHFLGNLSLDDCSRVIDALEMELVLPYDECPTLSFKAWVFIEAILAKIDDSEFINSLLRLMVDKKFYALATIYDQLRNVSNHENWGYIRDYNKLKDELRFATTETFHWRDWAIRVHELHRKMQGLCLNLSWVSHFRDDPDLVRERPSTIRVESLVRERDAESGGYRLLTLPQTLMASSEPFESREIVHALFLMGFFDDRMLSTMDEALRNYINTQQERSPDYDFYGKRLHHTIPLLDPLIPRLWINERENKKQREFQALLASPHPDYSTLSAAYRECSAQLPFFDFPQMQVHFARLLTEAKKEVLAEERFKALLFSSDCFIYRGWGKELHIRNKLFEQIYTGFPHWSPEDKLQILLSSGFNFPDNSGLYLMGMIYPEWKNLSWLELVEVYRRAINLCDSQIQWRNGGLQTLLTRNVLSICPSIHIFQEEVVAILVMLIQKNMENCMELWLRPHSDYERYPPVSNCDLPVSMMIPLSRILSRYATTPSETYLLEFNALLIQRIKTLSDKSARAFCIQKLIFLGEKPHHNRIADELAMTKAKEMLVAVMIDNIGKKDDRGYHFREVLLGFARKLLSGVSSQDAVDILSQLSVALETQYELSREIHRLLYPPESSSQQWALLPHLLQTDQFAHLLFGQDRDIWINYLSSSGSKADRDKLFKVVDDFFNNNPKRQQLVGRYYDKNQVKLYLMAFYDYFWNCPLEQRAVLVDNLIIPSSVEVDPEKKASAYQHGFELLCKKLFKEEAASPDDDLMRSLLTSFLETALPQDQQLFLAAMFVAVKETSGGQSTVGDKLVGFLENMGPAGVKIGQVAHSHPSTSPSLKSALAKLKSRANPPTREQVWAWIKDRLPEDQFSRITHLGEMLGSASVHVVMACQMQGLGDVVLSLTRPNAEKDSLKAYAHFERMIRHCQHARLDNSMRSSMLLILDEARRMLLAEIDDALGIRQLECAGQLYHKKAVSLSSDSASYTVIFHPCALIHSGTGYRFLERGYGRTFSSLKADVTVPRDVVIAIAIATLQVELTHILTNRFDSDRHEDQALIEVHGDQVNVYLFDFGELELQRLSQHETDSIAKLLRQLPAALQKGKDPALFLTEAIERCQIQGQPYRHLVRIQKAFLALSACIEVVGLQRLGEVFKSILPDIDAKYRNALCYGYGWGLLKKGGVWFTEKGRALTTTVDASLRTLFGD